MKRTSCTELPLHPREKNFNVTFYGNSNHGNINHGSNYHDHKAHSNVNQSSGTYYNISLGNSGLNRNNFVNRNHSNVTYYSNNNHGNKGHSNIKLNNGILDSKNLGNRNHSIQGQENVTNEKEIVLGYRLQEQKKERLNLEGDRKISASYRTSSRRRSENTRKELSVRLVQRDVALPSPPILPTLTTADQKKQRHRFEPSVVHGFYEGLVAELEKKQTFCSTQTNRKPMVRNDGKDFKRWTQVYCCCCSYIGPKSNPCGTPTKCSTHEKDRRT